MNATQTLFKVSGCGETDDVVESLECLRSMSAANLYEFSQANQITHNLCVDDIHIPADYINIIREGRFKMIPTIIGSTLLETGNFPNILFEDALNRGLTVEERDAMLYLAALNYNNPDLVFDYLVSFYVG